MKIYSNHMILYTMIEGTFALKYVLN